jgi:hypothetical protein
VAVIRDPGCSDQHRIVVVKYQSMTGKVVGFCLVGIAVSAPLWPGFKSQQGGFGTPFPAVSAVPVGEMPATNREQPMPKPSVRQEVFEINIQNGKIVSGSALLQAHEGDEVPLKIVSDRSDEVHLHGYDLDAHIAPGETATLAFTTGRTGRFGLEMHQARIELATLEVYPH